MADPNKKWSQKDKEDFARGAGGNPKPGAPSLAGSLAQAFAAKMNGAQAPAPSPSPEPKPTRLPANAHTMALQEAAEAAKQKYMAEHGVDEDGNPVEK